jgi:alpha-glucosidase
MPDNNLSREPSRTPMQWDATENAGFTNAKPWLRLHKSYRRINAEAQMHDQYSMLCLHKKIIELRHKEPALNIGDYKTVFADHQAMAFLRTAANADAFLVVLNMSHKPYYHTMEAGMEGVIEVSTTPEDEMAYVKGKLTLHGDEGIIIRLKNYKV